jgi:hypothetical protein
MYPYNCMRLSAIIFLVLGSVFSGVSAAQSFGPAAAMTTPVATASVPGENVPGLAGADVPIPDLVPAASRPQMSAELAVQTFQKRSARQAQELAGYSAATVIRAELPRSSQHGELELERHYSIPRTLTFKALHYIGDGFVKTNVIARLLQSEVDHVQKDDPAVTAIRPENYKFSHKSTTRIAGRVVHVYQIKPRRKRAGLFKGHIYLDASTGSLVRAEGRVVKSPSIFVNKIDFAQDYADINGFTLPTHIHTEAKAALVGHTVVDIVNSDWRLVLLSPESSASGSN